MTKESIAKLFNDLDAKDTESVDHSCSMYDGLTIMREFIPDADIVGLGDDCVAAVTLEDLAKAGIRRTDIVMLYNLGWWYENSDEGEEVDEYSRIIYTIF